MKGAMRPCPPSQRISPPQAGYASLRCVYAGNKDSTQKHGALLNRMALSAKGMMPMSSQQALGRELAAYGCDEWRVNVFGEPSGAIGAPPAVKGLTAQMVPSSYVNLPAQ